MLCWPCCHYSRKQDEKRWSLLELFFYASWGPQMLWLNFFIFLHVNKTADKLHVAILLILFRYTRTPTELVIRVLLVINLRVPLGGGKGNPFYVTFFIFFTYWRDSDDKRWLNVLLFWRLWERNDRYWGVFPFIHVSHEQDSSSYYFLFYLISYKRTEIHNKCKKKLRVFLLLYCKHKRSLADNTTTWSVVFLLLFVAKSKPTSRFLMLTPLLIYHHSGRDTWISLCLLFNVVRETRTFVIVLFPLVCFVTKRNRDGVVTTRFSMVLPIFMYLRNRSGTKFYSLPVWVRRTNLEHETNLTAILPLMYHKYAEGKCDYFLSLLWYRNIDYKTKRAAYNTLPLPLYRKVVKCSRTLQEFDEDDFIHRFEMFFPFFFRKTHRTKGIDDVVLFPLYWKRETFEGRVRRKMLLFNLYGTIHSVDNPDKPGECTTGFDILWPLIHYEKNEVGTFSNIRILPFFYSKYEKGNQKVTVLFPLYWKVLFHPGRATETPEFRQSLTVVLPFGYRETESRLAKTQTYAGLFFILPPYYRDNSYVGTETKQSRSLWPFFGRKHVTDAYVDKSTFTVAWPLFSSHSNLYHGTREKVHRIKRSRRLLTFTWKYTCSWDNLDFGAWLPSSVSRSYSSLTNASAEDVPIHMQMEVGGEDSQEMRETSDERAALASSEGAGSASPENVRAEEVSAHGEGLLEKQDTQPSSAYVEELQEATPPEASLGLDAVSERSDSSYSESTMESSDSTMESESEEFDISLSSSSSDGGYGGGLLGGADSDKKFTSDNGGIEPDQDHEADGTGDQPARRKIAEGKNVQLFPFFVYARTWGQSASKFHWRIPGLCSFSEVENKQPPNVPHYQRHIWDLAFLYFLTVELALCRFRKVRGDSYDVVLRYAMPFFYHRKSGASVQTAFLWLFHPVVSLLFRGRLIGEKNATYRFGPFLVAKTDNEGKLRTVLCLTLCGVALIRYHRKGHFHVFPLFYSHRSGQGEDASWHWALLGYSRAAVFFRSKHRTYLLLLFYFERHVNSGDDVDDTVRFSVLWLLHYRAAIFHYDSDWRWFILLVIYKDLPKAGTRTAFLWIFHPVLSVVYHDPRQRTSVFPLFWRSFYKSDTAGADDGLEEKWALLWFFHPLVSVIFYDTSKLFRVFLLCWISNDESAPDQLALGWLLHPRYSLVRYYPDGTSHLLVLAWRRAKTHEWGLLWLLHYSVAASAKRNLQPGRKSDNPDYVIYVLFFLFYVHFHSAVHWLVCLLFYKKTVAFSHAIISVFRFLYRLVLFKSHDGTVTHLEINPLLFYRNTERRKLTLLLAGVFGVREKNFTLFWCIKIAR